MKTSSSFLLRAGFIVAASFLLALPFLIPAKGSADLSYTYCRVGPYGYGVTTERSVYNQGEIVNYCVAGYNTIPLYLGGSQPWYVADQNGFLVFSDANNPYPTNTFAGTWSGKNYAGVDVPPGFYRIVYPALPGFPSASFQIVGPTVNPYPPPQTYYPPPPPYPYYPPSNPYYPPSQPYPPPAPQPLAYQPPPVYYYPTLTPNAHTISPGGFLTVRGNGFAPHEEVRLYVSGVYASSAWANQNGRMHFRTTVPYGAGPISISAVGASSGASAVESVTVVP